MTMLPVTSAPVMFVAHVFLLVASMPWVFAALGLFAMLAISKATSASGKHDSPTSIPPAHVADAAVRLHAAPSKSACCAAYASSSRN